MIYHRPIPDGSQIQNGKIMRTRVGDMFKYHVVLTVKRPVSKPLPVPHNVAIGIDIGFRHTGDTIQVASITSTDPEKPPSQILIPVKVMRGMERVIELQSILDDAASDLGKITKPILKQKPLSEECPRYSLWRAAAKYPNNVTLSFETAYKVARWLDVDPEYIPAEAAKLFRNWWFAYSRRYRELHNLKAKQLLHRKHF